MSRIQSTVYDVPVLSHVCGTSIYSVGIHGIGVTDEFRCVTCESCDMSTEMKGTKLQWK